MMRLPSEDTRVTLAAILEAQPFVRALRPADRALLAGCGSLVSYHAGEFVFHEGGFADAFYLIYHGSVALEVAVPAGPPVTLETLGAGEVLGWSWLFPPYRWVFDARAGAVTRLVKLDAACVRGQAERNPSFGYALMQRVAQSMAARLQAARLQLMDVYGESRH